MVLNALGMRTGIHIGLMHTAMYDPSEGILITSDFAARALSMPAGTGPHSLIHATIKKFGHYMPITANDSAQEIIEAARIVQNIHDSAKEDRAKHAVDGRLQYHIGANFLIKRSRVPINSSAPIGPLPLQLPEEFHPLPQPTDSQGDRRQVGEGLREC
jgi:hypothetical protein